jgi:hypothetical protein
MSDLSDVATNGCADHYDKVVMANFTDDPLLCEGYALEQNKHFSVQCPFPTTLNRFSPDQWAANTEGILCDGNNDILCAAQRNPITTSINSQVAKTLSLVNIDSRLIRNAEQVASCERTLSVLKLLNKLHCDDDNIRYSLFLAWIALAVTGSAGAFLFVVLLLLHRTTPACHKTTFTAVYGPGLPLHYDHDLVYQSFVYSEGAAFQTVRHVIQLSVCPSSRRRHGRLRVPLLYVAGIELGVKGHERN